MSLQQPNIQLQTCTGFPFAFPLLGLYIFGCVSNENILFPSMCHYIFLYPNSIFCYCGGDILAILFMLSSSLWFCVTVQCTVCNTDLCLEWGINEFSLWICFSWQEDLGTVTVRSVMRFKGSCGEDSGGLTWTFLWQFPVTVSAAIWKMPSSGNSFCQD